MVHKHADTEHHRDKRNLNLSLAEIDHYFINNVLNGTIFTFSSVFLAHSNFERNRYTCRGCLTDKSMEQAIVLLSPMSDNNSERPVHNTRIVLFQFRVQVRGDKCMEKNNGFIFDRGFDECDANMFD